MYYSAVGLGRGGGGSPGEEPRIEQETGDDMTGGRTPTGESLFTHFASLTYAYFYLMTIIKLKL